MIGYLKGSDMRSAVAPVSGQHSNLNKDSVFRAVHGAITPNSPGAWESFRFAPACQETRTFDSDEADALAFKAEESDDLVRSTRRGFKALKKMCKNSFLVNEIYEKYRQVEASTELRSQRIKKESAIHLQGLRPKYARLGRSLDAANSIAEQAISNLSTSL